MIEINTCEIAACISWNTSGSIGFKKSTPETSAAKVGWRGVTVKEEVL